MFTLSSSNFSFAKNQGRSWNTSCFRQLTLHLGLCRNVGVSLPYPAERQKDQLHFTYLDTVGRPVVIIKNAKLVEQHIDDFTVSSN